MPSRVRQICPPARARDERGAVAILIALALTALLIGAAMVLDFGLVRVDRQVNKSAADAAAIAGLQGMKASDESARPFVGVCNAIRYLQANHDRFSGVTSTSGTWTDGTTPGNPKGDGCDPANTGLRNQVCVPGNPSSWARFTWTGAWQSEPLQVVIQSGYELDGSGWREESLPAAQSDNDDGAQGCYQLMVTVTQNRDPGLGSLATTADLVSSIRSVGRVKTAPGGDAPAMLLLKRSGCPILQTGGSGGGSFIRVFGAISTDGKTQPGTIHADSSGASCSGGSNQNIFLGRAANGIVAYAAPLSAASPTTADPTKPGQISSVAGSTGLNADSGIIRDRTGSDWNSNVYGAGGLNAAAPGTKSGPTGRPLVTRKLVDERYLGAVKGIIDTAQSTVFGSVTNGNAASQGYTVVGCGASGSVSGAKIFVNCTDNVGFRGPVSFTNAETVVFNGRVNPQGEVAAPQAEKVYVFGLAGRAAVDLSSGNSLRLHTNGQSVCTGNNTSEKAIFVIKEGPFKQSNGGALQMCNTTVVMMSGQSDACLPTVGYATAAPPDATPCGSTSSLVGSGQLDQTGGTVDWTAPNQYDNLTDDDGAPLPIATSAWTDENGPEDLAFWSESGTDSSNTYNVNGGGALRAVGVYMVPNADPFIIGGGAAQSLFNAQYIATSISLNGNGTNISMSVDPNAAVTLPQLDLIGLVR